MGLLSRNYSSHLLHCFGDERRSMVQHVEKMSVALTPEMAAAVRHAVASGDTHRRARSFERRFACGKRIRLRASMRSRSFAGSGVRGSRAGRPRPSISPRSSRKVGACSPGSGNAHAREWRATRSGPKQRPICWRSGCTLRKTALGRPIASLTGLRPDAGCLPTILASGAHARRSHRTRGCGSSRDISLLNREQDDGIEIVRVVHGARRVEQIEF